MTVEGPITITLSGSVSMNFNPTNLKDTRFKEQFVCDVIAFIYNTPITHIFSYIPTKSQKLTEKLTVESIDKFIEFYMDLGLDDNSTRDIDLAHKTLTLKKQLMQLDSIQLVPVYKIPGSDYKDEPADIEF